jgi:glutamate synthase domain-containing protein 1
LPEKGAYGTGIFFLERETAATAEKRFAECAAQQGVEVICWRDVPSDNSCLGEVAKSTEPFLRQVFVRSADPNIVNQEFEKKVILRNPRHNSDLD